MTSNIIKNNLLALIFEGKKTIEFRNKNEFNEIIKFNIVSGKNLNFVINNNNEIFNINYDGYFKILVQDLIHFYENFINQEENKCQCDNCLKLFYLLELKTNLDWIKNEWKNIKLQLLNKEIIYIFHILNISEIEAIRCPYDNKLLYKKINKGIIEIKCNNCKKKHVININK